MNNISAFLPDRELQTMHRSNDPETSRLAAQKVKRKLTQKQAQVLSVFELSPHGIIGAELNRVCRNLWGWDENTSTARTRRAELEKAGLIQKTEKKRRNRSQSLEQVYQITDRGIAVAKKLHN